LKTLAIIILSVIFLILVQAAYSIEAPYPWLKAAWGAGDLITYVGTIFLGIVAMVQTKRANSISERLLRMEKSKYSMEESKYSMEHSKSSPLVSLTSKIISGINENDIPNEAVWINFTSSKINKDFLDSSVTKTSDDTFYEESTLNFYIELRNVSDVSITDIVADCFIDNNENPSNTIKMPVNYSNWIDFPPGIVKRIYFTVPTYIPRPRSDVIHYEDSILLYKEKKKIVEKDTKHNDLIRLKFCNVYGYVEYYDVKFLDLEFSRRSAY